MVPEAIHRSTHSIFSPLWLVTEIIVFVELMLELILYGHRILQEYKSLTN